MEREFPLDRAQIARASRTAQKRPDDAEARAHVEELRRAYAERKLTAYIARVVDAAPPLTPEQRDRLAALLRPSTDARRSA